MARVVFGSSEAQAILRKDRLLYAEAAREAAIEKARLEGEEIEWEVSIELQRTEIVRAYSEEEAWNIAAVLLWSDEEITGVERR